MLASTGRRSGQERSDQASDQAYGPSRCNSPVLLYSENLYADDSIERRIYGPDVRVIFPQGVLASVADLYPDADCSGGGWIDDHALQGDGSGPATLPLKAARDLPWDGRGV